MGVGADEKEIYMVKLVIRSSFDLDIFALFKVLFCKSGTTGLWMVAKRFTYS